MEQWLRWLSILQGIAQNGLTYGKGSFDIERYQQLQKVVAQMFSAFSGFPEQQILTVFEKEYGYATPKIDVRGVVFKDQKILLVRERSDELWSLPGGWADVDDSPSEAVIKEIREETGYIAKATKLLAVLDKRKHDHPIHWPHIYKLFFMCEIISGEPQENLEIMEIAFFDKNNLPPLSQDRVSKAQIMRMYEHLANSTLPTDFD